MDWRNRTRVRRHRDSSRLRADSRYVPTICCRAAPATASIVHATAAPASSVRNRIGIDVHRCCDARDRFRCCCCRRYCIRCRCCIHHRRCRVCERDDDDADDDRLDRSAAWNLPYRSTFNDLFHSRNLTLTFYVEKSRKKSGKRIRQNSYNFAICVYPVSSLKLRISTQKHFCYERVLVSCFQKNSLHCIGCIDFSSDQLINDF